MAGFLQFDPDKWEPNGDEPAAKAAKPAEAEPPLATLASLAALPAHVVDGVGRLAKVAVPRTVNAKAWALAITDAARLVDDGWALSALRLGWSELDLFGAVIDPAGDPFADGLAVRLQGCDLLAISGGFATARDSKGTRHYLHRLTSEGAKLLWDLGRGGR